MIDKSALITVLEGINQLIQLEKQCNDENTAESRIHQKILKYSLRRLAIPISIDHCSIDVITNTARCLLEIEVILLWLKSDQENYKAFKAAAEFANIDLMKSMKKFQIKAFPEDSTVEATFDKHVQEMEEKLKTNGHSQYAEKVDELFKMKSLAKKFDIEERYKAHFDFYSKLSHPTAWAILTDETSNEHEQIINKSLDNIGWSLKNIETILTTS